MKPLLAVVAVTVSLLFAGGCGRAAPGLAQPASAQPAYPLWDAKESVAEYVQRAGIKDVQIELKLDANMAMKLALIPAGKFLMGSGENEPNRLINEGPQHEVTISRPLYMGVYDVTQEQYQAVMGTNPSNFKGASNPVDQVSWEDAAAFCKQLSARTGEAVRLPTEAQWEFACRAGTTTPFNTGETISADQANYNAAFTYAGGSRGEYRQKTTPVGSFKPNAFGLYDMHGNVWQWCRDWYGSYSDKAKTDPAGPDSGTTRVLRGGAWFTNPWSCRCAQRYAVVPSYRYVNFGFRVVVNAD